MTALHIADPQAAVRAENAIRDILYLYRDLVAYEGFVGDDDLGTFDPWEFLQATASDDWATEQDLKLLHEGSAVALLCNLMDQFVQPWPDVERFRLQLEAGSFDGLPLARKALRAGLEGPHELHTAFQPVFHDYVLGYFSALVE